MAKLKETRRNPGFNEDMGMANKYLEKIAEEVKKKESNFGLRATGVAAGSIMASQGIGVTAMKHVKTSKGNATSDTVKSYVREKGLGPITSVRKNGRGVVEKGLFSGMNAARLDANGPHMMSRHGRNTMPGVFKENLKDFHINMAGSKDKDVLLHELGHVNLRKKLGTKATKAVDYSRTLGVMGSVPGGIAAYHAIKNSDSKTGAAVGTAAALGLAAPTLLDEGYASGSAVKHIFKKQGLGAATRTAGKMAGTYSTYLGMMSPLLAGAYFGNKARTERLQQAKKTQK